MSLTISTNGINLIKMFEGCRLSAYKDAVGVITIGYGWTKSIDGKPLTMNTKISQDKAELLLKEGLKLYEEKVNKYDSRYHWNQNQFDALVSFCYNIGNIDQLTADGTRDIKTISSKMLLYNKAAGKILDGLTKRRKAEQELFLKPEVQNTQAASVEISHVQINYQPGQQYTDMVDGLRIRTKKASQSTLILPNADIIGSLEKGTKVKNMATARVGDAIWMYLGLDIKGREQWVCADNGNKAYIK